MDVETCPLEAARLCSAKAVGVCPRCCCACSLFSNCQGRSFCVAVPRCPVTHCRAFRLLPVFSVVCKAALNIHGQVFLFGFFFSFFSYLFLRETKPDWGRGREKVRERESQVGAALSVQSPMWGSNPRTHGQVLCGHMFFFFWDPQEWSGWLCGKSEYLLGCLQGGLCSLSSPRSVTSHSVLLVFNSGIHKLNVPAPGIQLTRCQELPPQV